MLLLGREDLVRREGASTTGMSAPLTDGSNDNEDAAKRKVFALRSVLTQRFRHRPWSCFPIWQESQQTLRLFAERERVAVDELLGDGRSYKDMSDLRRSFVGAVNRRLRTVVGDRSVVLFSSERNRKRIRVLPATAFALRHAMGMPELSDDDEDFEEFDLDGPLAEEPPHYAEQPGWGHSGRESQ